MNKKRLNVYIKIIPKKEIQDLQLHQKLMNEIENNKVKQHFSYLVNQLRFIFINKNA